MYNVDLKRTSKKNKLSNFVNGVSQENIILLLSFIGIGILIFTIIPFLVSNHKRTVYRNEWRKTQKIQQIDITPGIPVNTRRLSYDSPEFYLE